MKNAGTGNGLSVISEILYSVEGNIVRVVVVMSAVECGAAEEYYIVSVKLKVYVLEADMLRVGSSVINKLAHGAEAL